MQDLKTIEMFIYCSKTIQWCTCLKANNTPENN